MFLKYLFLNDIFLRSMVKTVLTCDWMAWTVWYCSCNASIRDDRVVICCMSVSTFDSTAASVDDKTVTLVFTVSSRDSSRSIRRRLSVTFRFRRSDDLTSYNNTHGYETCSF